MFRWMNARKYRFVKPSILSSVTVAMVAQICCVPQLIAMEIRENLNQSRQDQAMRENRYTFDGSSHSERMKQVGTHLQTISNFSQHSHSRNIDTLTEDIIFLKHELRGMYSTMHVKANELRAHLVNQSMPPVVIDRLDSYIENQTAEYLETNRHIAQVEKVARDGGEERVRALMELRSHIKNVYGDSQAYLSEEIKKRNVKHPRRQSASEIKSLSSVPFFDYPWEFASTGDFVGSIFGDITAGVVDDPGSDGVDADLEEAFPEVVFSDAINNLVIALEKDPVRIFEFVRNNIVYEPYFGSVKSGDRTLLDGQGNDLDQASLLISLLRKAEIHARYKYGTIEIDIDDAADWLGVLSPSAMIEVLRKGGVPADLRYENNTATALRVDHVWVSANVDVEPFRGARVGDVNDNGDTWIDLDPSFKQHEFSSTDLTQALVLEPALLHASSQVGAEISHINEEELVGKADKLDDLLLESELLSVAEPLRNYLADEELVAESVFWNREISDQRFGLFPISDEYTVVNNGITTRDVPESLTHRLEMVVYDSDGVRVSEFSLDNELVPGLTRLSELAGTRIILGYEADSDSQEVLNSQPLPTGFDDFAGAILQVEPTLYIGDERVSASPDSVSFSPGEFHIVEFEFYSPGVTEPDEADVYRQVVRAGGIHSFVLNGQHTPGGEIDGIRAEIDGLFNGGLDQFQDYEAVIRSIGSALDSAGRTYFHQMDRYNSMTSGAMGVYATRLPSMARVSWEMTTPTPNAPAALESGPVSFDIVSDVYATADRFPEYQGDEEGNTGSTRFRMASSILSNSVEVNAIKQVFLAVEGISANNAIKAANVDEDLQGSTSDSVIYTIAPGANLEELFGTEGSLEQLPDKMQQLVRNIATDDTEFVVLDTAVQSASGQNILALHAYERSTGNGTVTQFNEDLDSFMSASVDVIHLLDSDADSQSDEVVPSFINLIHHSGTDRVGYMNLLGAASDSLSVFNGITESTALWYLPAVATVNDWLTNRDDVDSVTLPLSVIMLTQPIDEFVTAPGILDFVFDLQNPTNPDWIAIPTFANGNDEESIEIGGTLTRAGKLTVTITNSVGTDVIVEEKNAPNAVEVLEPFYVSIGSNIPSADRVDGIYSYRAVASRISADGQSTEESIPVEGSFGVDLTLPEVNLVSGTPQLQGTFRIEGSAFDAIALDRAILDVHGPDSVLLYRKEITDPIFANSQLAFLDTTSGLFTGRNSETCDVTLTAWDVAGNSVSTASTLTIDNPPDPSSIVVTVDNFIVSHDHDSDAQTSPVSFSSSSPLSYIDMDQNYIEIQAVADLEIGWPNVVDTEVLQNLRFDKAELLLDDLVIQEVTLSDADLGSDLFNLSTQLVMDFQYPLAEISSTSTHQFKLRVTPAIGPQPADEVGDVFTINTQPIQDFVVTSSYIDLESPTLILSATITNSNMTTPNGSSVTDIGRYWFVGVFSGQSSVGTLLDDWVYLPPNAFSGSGTDSLVSGNYLSDGNPNGYVGQEPGNASSIEVGINFSNASLPDGEHWIQLLASRFDGNFDSELFDIESTVGVRHAITIDMSNAPRAVLSDISDPSDLDTVPEIENYSPTAVDSGFYDVAGYAYDLDPQQVGVKYRIEVRPSGEALYGEPDGPADLPEAMWYAIPPTDPQQDSWAIRSLDTQNLDDAWYTPAEDSQLAAGPGVPPHHLARLDLTGLRDGDYQIALVVDSGDEIAVDLGRLSLSSPAKIGRFTFSQEDISLETIGFPMSLVRTYDSLNQDVDGPFGVGWSMSIFDLDIELHENRVEFDSLYPPNQSGIPNDLEIRNSGIMDRAVSLTLPDGRRVTFPFFVEPLGAEGKLYAKYHSPPGYDNLILTPGFTWEENEYFINTLLGSLQWAGDPFNSPEQHHDIPGWTLETEDGIRYVILREMILEGPLSFVASASASQSSGIGTVYGDPYISKIILPTGESVGINRNSDYEIEGFSIEDADGNVQGSDELIRFVYSDDPDNPRVIAAFGPSAPGSSNSWGEPLYIYGYTGDKLTTVGRVNSVIPDPNMDEDYQWDFSDCECDETTFEYGDSDYPGLITQINDPRGLQPVLSEYDDSGRLVKTIDQYGRVIEVSRDTDAQTETIIDRGTEPATTTIYTYDDMGNVIREEHSSGKIIVRDYDDDNRLLSEQDLSRDQGTEYEYIDLSGGVDRTVVTDAMGNVTETDLETSYRGVPESIVTTQYFSGRDPIVTEQNFDYRGNLTDTISGSTRVENEYDSRNRLTATLVPEIDPDTGVPTSEMVARTKYFYDDDNPALLIGVEQIDPDTADVVRQSFLHDHLGRQWASYTVTTVGTTDHVVADIQDYDHAGRVVGTYRKESIGTFDAALDTPSSWGIRLTTTAYNAIDQVVASIDHVSSTTSTTLYDLRGNVIETAIWPADLSSDPVKFDELISRLSIPQASANDPFATIPDFSNLSFPSDSVGPVVTRTSYNTLGQAEFVSEPVSMTAAEYASSTFVFSTDVARTEFNSLGQATSRYRGVAEFVIGMNGDGWYEMQATSVGTSDRLSSTEYDLLGRVYESTSYNALNGIDPVTTEYIYDDNDRQKFTRILGMGEDNSDLITEYEYDEAGRQIAVIDPDGNRVEYEYDPEGRRTHTLFDDPVYGTTFAETNFDLRGRRVSETDPSGGFKSFGYDGSDKLTTVRLVDPDNGDSIQYEYNYDLNGNLQSIEEPNSATTTFEYDHLGRRVQRTLPGARSESWDYYDHDELAIDGASYGKVQSHTDFNGNVTEYEYDPLGRLVSKSHLESGSSNVTREYVSSYDEYGRLAQLHRYPGEQGTVSADRSTGWVYDSYGRLIKLYQPEGILVYTYSQPTGRLSSIKSFDGNNAVYPNDPISPTDGITTNTYKYDDLGRLESVVHSSGSVDLINDPTWTYGYTNIGRRAFVEYSEGSSDSHVTLYEYDTLGRLTALENWEGTEAAPTSLISAYHYTHNADGRRASVNEVRRDTGGLSHYGVSYKYDAFGRLIHENAQPLSSTSLTYIRGTTNSSWVSHDDNDERHFNRTYTYDSVGNRVSKYTNYDVSVTNADEFEQYNYMLDGSGRLQSMTKHSGDSNAGVQTGAESYLYDDNGFMLQKLVSTDADSTPEWVHDYTADVEGRLATYTRSGAIPLATQTYDYNESGIRVKAGSSSGDRFFLIDSMNPTGYAQVVLERSGGPLNSESKTYALGDDVLGQQAGTAMQSLLADGHGSTRQLYTSPMTSEQYDYDAYGEAFGWGLDDPSVLSRPSTDLLYAGEQWDADLGMQYLRARYYLPSQGIFNRLDPFLGNHDDPQSLNKYAYVHGDPINLFDPSGLFSVTDVLGSLLIKTKLLTIPTLAGGAVSKLLGGSFIQGLAAGFQLGVGLQLALSRGGPAGLYKVIGVGFIALALESIALIGEYALGSSFDGIGALIDSVGMQIDGQFVWGLLVAFSDGVFDSAVELFTSTAVGAFTMLFQAFNVAIRSLIQDGALTGGEGYRASLSTLISIAIEIAFMFVLAGPGNPIPRALERRISRIAGGFFGQLILANPGDTAADVARYAGDPIANWVVNYAGPPIARITESFSALF